MRSNTEEERSKAGRHWLWVDTLDHALHGRSLEDNHILVHTEFNIPNFNYIFLGVEGRGENEAQAADD